MASWTLTFLIIALLAALLSFAGVAGGATWIAKTVFALFLALFLVALFVHRKKGAARTKTQHRNII